MKCLLCGFENSEDSRFCMGCGTVIPRCPTCGSQLTTRERFCMNDGTRLPEDLLMLVPETVEDDGFEEVAVEQMIGATVQDAVTEQITVPDCAPRKAFCMGCGTQIWEGEEYCENCRRAAGAVATGVCASCGMPCAPGRDYCDYCDPNKPVVVVNRDYDDRRGTIRKANTSVKKKSKVGGWLIALLVILLLLLIGAAAVMFASESGWIELPDFLSSDRDDDRDRDKNDRDDGDEDDKDDGASAADPDDDTVEGEQPETTVPTEPPAEAPTEAPTEEPTQEPTVSVPAEAEDAALLNFVNNCDKVLFDKEDIASFDKEQARLARNACYAHGGRKFKDKELQAYYEQFDWYVPIYEPSDFNSHYDEAMNTYQRKNLALISEYEKEMGFK